MFLGFLSVLSFVHENCTETNELQIYTIPSMLCEEWIWRTSIENIIISVLEIIRPYASADKSNNRHYNLHFMFGMLL